jgi:translocator protein
MLNFLKNIFKIKKTTEKERVISGVLAFAFVFLMGYGGSSVPDAWYQALKKPEVVPPGFVFPVVWTILFALIGYSMYLTWNYYESDLKRRLFSVFYIINGVFIYLWSYLFFGRHNIAGAFYTIIGIIIVTEVMILIAFQNNKKAAYILMPYLAWILFATYLNATIITLN